MATVRMEFYFETDYAKDVDMMRDIASVLGGQQTSKKPLKIAEVLAKTQELIAESQPKEEAELTPQQKAAKTRKANKAKKAAQAEALQTEAAEAEAKAKAEEEKLRKAEAAESAAAQKAGAEPIEDDGDFGFETGEPLMPTEYYKPTREELSAALTNITSKSVANKKAVRAILAELGCTKVTDIDEDDWGLFFSKLQALDPVKK